MSLQEAAVAAFRKHGSPMRVKELADAIREQGYTSKANETSFVTHLGQVLKRSKEFSRLSRGIYQLSEGKAMSRRVKTLPRIDVVDEVEETPQITHDLLNVCPCCQMDLRQIKNGLDEQFRAVAIVKCPRCNINLAAVQEALRPEIQALAPDRARLVFERVRNFILKTI